MTYTDYLSSIKNELYRTGRAKKSLRVKTVMEHFGYRRRSQVFIDDFNAALDALGLCTTPAFDMYIPFDARISISIKGVFVPQPNEPMSEKLREPILVKDDFFHYLFDFGSKQEYEQFQACLDSTQPVGLFIVPQQEDFFSDLVVKLLNYELIRKYQYRGENNITESSNMEFSTTRNSDYDNYLEQQKAVSTSIFHFNRSTMTNVLLGTTGLELLDSEKFDQQFEQLSLYAHKYNSEQFFILFHCPSQLEIQAQQKEDIFGYLIDKVASKIPFTFTLKCKYPNDLFIEQKEEVYAHFRLLLEVPYYDVEQEDLSLRDYFLELQKAQIQAESQLLLRIKAEHFCTLKWGQESAEHVYLKYFAVNTLESLGYELSQIHCEIQMTPDEQQETNKRRPDVYVENKVIVEVETLRGKGFGGDNVFFDLIYRILAKSDGWTNKLESVWLVLPGFEIARNYYQLKKTKEILEYKLAQRYDHFFELVLMTPDYENHQLVPVSFDFIEYPSFEYIPDKHRVKIPNLPQVKLDFSQVKGLNEEKEKLSKILKLQSKGYKSTIGGILFFGLPGCGKTLLANAFANESGRYFFKFSPADIKSMWIGESQKNIRDVFAQAKKKAPSVLFIDELDSIGFNRNEIHAHTDQKATINQLLIELNNIRDSDVIVIAATNYLSGIDSALKRSGRLDWKIPIFPPDKAERMNLFRHYLSQIEINIVLVSLDILADKSARFTSSDIELVCREVRNAIALDEISSTLTTSDVITYINNLQDGGLTLNEAQVKEFLHECKMLSVKNPKLEILRLEWGFTQI